VPRFAAEEYDDQQLEWYRILTDITYRTLNFPSVSAFLDTFTEKLGIKDEIAARVYRVPSAGQTRGNLLGKISRRTGVIIIYPPLIWTDTKEKPDYLPDGAMGRVCSEAIVTVIHELLHRSGVIDHDELNQRMKAPCDEFMRLYVDQYGQEFHAMFDPLLRLSDKTNKKKKRRN
jgi:hypothetical protein